MLRVSCAVKVWQQAWTPMMMVRWSFDSPGSVNSVWTSSERLKAAEDLLASLTSGCRCQTGCLTKHCKCHKCSNPCLFTCLGFARKLASSNAQILHTVFAGDDDNSDSDGASTDTTLLSSYDKDVSKSSNIEERPERSR